jgi:hypothetical protein
MYLLTSRGRSPEFLMELPIQSFKRYIEKFKVDNTPED